MASSETSYTVKYTDPGKGAITVNDNLLDKTTSLTFVGRNKSMYAQYIAENFLHLLENFARSTEPGAELNEASPITGQLWYDTTANIDILKVFNGSKFVPVSAINKDISAPPTASSRAGDLWVNASTKQLYIYSGNTGNTAGSWNLIGPQFSSGLNTGPLSETMIDDAGDSRSILSFYANNDRIAIISTGSFIPKVTTFGFATINRGITLSSETNNVNDAIKLWGNASSADSLVYKGTTVPAVNFMRTDITTEATSINVKSNDGISMGSDLSFKITTSDTDVKLTSKTGKNIKVNFSSDSGVTSNLVITASSVGIGQGNTAPQATLDVLGSALISQTLSVTGTTDSTSLTSGSIITAGGLGVTKNSNFGGTSTFNNTLYVYRSTAGPVLIPKYSPNQPIEDRPLYDIGSQTLPFRNVYATKFVGDFDGTHTGTFTGSISGTASSLTDSRSFRLDGDVVAEPQFFNGTSNVRLATTITSALISSKNAASESFSSDQLLIQRGSVGLLRIRKDDFLREVATVPIGVIMPYAGETLPTGYLLCDGSEVSTITYNKLYNVIGDNYRNVSLLKGANTFALPDLRGRFPLGRDSMTNDLPDVTKGNSTFNAGGNRNGLNSDSTAAARRVHDSAASTIGFGAGNDAAGTLAPAGTPGSEMSSVVSNKASSIMNPYQTINYIIFTGIV
jgi:microcystin-dependent protein